MGICFNERNTNRNKANNMDAPEPNFYFVTKPSVSLSLPDQSELKTKGDNKNIIKMKLIIENNDVNKPTKILYRINKKIEGCDINELNDINTELYINGKQYKYKSYFTPEKEGTYDIQLNIKILMKNCCCLFYGLNLQNLDLSSFNTQNVTNMSYMFWNCKIQNLDLSSFNTLNVTNMIYMFGECRNLKSLDLSSFNTQNVTNMSYMFYLCSNLQNLDLSSFNTKNVTNMSYMFWNCINLQTLDLSSFNTQNLKSYDSMFYSTYNLKRVIISYEASRISNILSENIIFYA